MSFQLDTGICERTHSATFNEDELTGNPSTLQVLSLRKLGKHQENKHLSSDRYRIVLSDRAHFLQAVLATHLNHMVVEEHLKKYSIISVERLSCSYLQDKRVAIVMALRILGQKDEKIGEPISLETNANLPDALTAVENPLPQQPSAQFTSSNEVPALSVRLPPQKGNWLPVEGLSPYHTNWTIKARVMQKSELKSYSSARGEGKFFNVTFMDETGQTRATAFNAIADKLYPKLEEHKVYYVSKGKVNLAKKKFSNVQNDFEITLEAKSEIQECLETSNLPTIKYRFVTLQELHDLPEGSNCVDVIGVLKEYGDVSGVNSKATNRMMQKRDIILVDKSDLSVRLTLWGHQARNFQPDGQNPVIAFRVSKSSNMKVRRSLGMTSTSIMTHNPDIPESYVLRSWYDSTGCHSIFQSQNNAGGSF
ncbi:hypothetical protein EV360DRAFT_56864, partial [Lentinula raphanica]